MSFSQDGKALKFVGEWSNDLSWCPSQLMREFKYDGKTYELYCRWRHEDPWTFAFYELGAKSSGSLEWCKMDFGTWVSIGEGMSEDDKIEDVHAHAETLLTTHLQEADQ